MEYSTTEIQAVEAAQLIANANPALDKPQTCAINPRKFRRTPRLSVEYDERGYRHSDLVLFNGDHESALLYAQIRYWSGTGRNGKPRASIEIKGKGRGWIAKSAEMLWDELMLTEDQVRRINAVFKAGNAVEVETAMYKRSKCTHYRYVSPHAQEGTLPENPESHSGKIPNHTPGKPHVFTETMAETVSKNKDFVDAPLSTEAAPDNSTTQSGKDEPQTQQVTPDKPRGLWEQLMREFHPEQGVRVPGENKMLRDLRKDLDAQTDLPDSMVVVRFLIERWYQWAPSGVNPKPQYLTSHRGMALEYFRKFYVSPEQAAADAAQKAADLAKWETEAEAAKAQKAAAPKKKSTFQMTDEEYAEYREALTPEWMKPTQQDSTPAAEPLTLVPMPEPVHYLTADDYEECQEPPDDYPKAPPTQKELLAAVKTKELERLAAKNKATIFQHGKPKALKASATA